MTKSELIELLASDYPWLSSKDTELAVTAIMEALANSLSQQRRIEIRGFGVIYRPARTGRNPRTGAQVAVPEKTLPYFKAGKLLRLWVNIAYGVNQAECASSLTTKIASSSSR